MEPTAVAGAKRLEPDYVIKLVATSLSLGLLLMLIRARVTNFNYLTTLRRSAGLVLEAYYDLLYVSVITTAFLGLCLIIPKNQAKRRALYRTFLGFALFSTLAALANVKLVRMLGRPMNYQWLYYSDFLSSQDARNAILAELSWKLLLVAAACIIALLALARVLYIGLRALFRTVGSRRPTVAVVVMLTVYFPIGGIIVGRQNWKASKVENPVVSFVRSVVIAQQSPKLMTMKTSVGSRDFDPPRQSTPARSAIPRRGKEPIRNVVLVVLESVPAEYLEAFGGPYAVTPELGKYMERSALFDHIYAHCPTTSYSLVSLLLSIYPPVSYQGITEERPALRFPSLSSELKRRGYRTAFLSSSDLRHQHTDTFLSHRQFDKIEDDRSLPCNSPVLVASTRHWPFLNGKDDVCAGDALIDWITSDPRKPFFAVLWTMMTHYPYFAAGRELDFGVAERFNRYLNALRHDDWVLGRLLHSLQEHELDKSTLVVIVGDHGEEFGQHGQWTHSQSLYEPSVHVPLILINPELFNGERWPVVGGLIDFAPTVMSILGMDSPARWQGRSLWSTNRSGRVYFFAPWSDHLFGFRENNMKVIYNASDNHFEIYDLAKDPKEMVNRAPEMREVIQIGQQRLAAWVQYQNKAMRELFSENEAR